MKKRKTYDDDDGRTIANMNVDGMPWYAKRPAPQENGDAPTAIDSNSSGNLAVIWGVLKAALLITAVFALGYLLFILFCTLIWFK